MTGARKNRDRVFTLLCLSATLLGVALLVILLWSVFKPGTARLSWQFLSSFPSRFPEKSGILSALMGSLWVIALTGLFAVPVGVCAAIYLEEYTRKKNRFTEFVQLNISNLAGVPSIVYGLLGLAVFVRWMDLGRSILAGALTMSLLILPTVIIVSQEALRAVPRSYREGSLALGATEWQTIRRQVLPSASSGILTGIILSLSRAIGETAPLIVVGAVAYVARVPKGVGDTFTVLPIQIYNWISEAKEGFHVAAAAAIIVLMVTLLALNSVAIWLRSRSRARA
jgi:phosphate transport system permease protein